MKILKQCIDLFVFCFPAMTCCNLVFDWLLQEKFEREQQKIRLQYEEEKKRAKEVEKQKQDKVGQFTFV